MNYSVNITLMEMNIISFIIFIQIYYVHSQPQGLDKKHSYILFGAELAQVFIK